MKHYLGRNTRAMQFALALAALTLFPSCGRLSRDNSPSNQPSAILATTRPAKLNINTATASDLEKLPGVGKVLADRIVAHRENFGPFRRPEDLIIVRGISDRKFRELRTLITAAQ
jgi:competence protein ComEA